MNEDLIPLLNKAYFFLKFRPRSEKEVRDYLYKKIAKRHWSRDDAEEIIDDLKEQGLINDGEFVAWFVRQRTALKPKAKRLLSRELLQKGVKKELIEEYFGHHAVDEEDLARKILEIRWPRFKNLDARSRFKKAVSFLARRGFSFDTAKKTIEDLSKKE